MNTRTLGAQMFEVEVAFPFPQPEILAAASRRREEEGRGEAALSARDSAEGDEHRLARRKSGAISRASRRSVSADSLSKWPSRLGSAMRFKCNSIFPAAPFTQRQWSGARSKDREWELSSRNCRREPGRPCTSFCRSCSERFARSNKSVLLFLVEDQAADVASWARDCHAFGLS